MKIDEAVAEVRECLSDSASLSDDREVRVVNPVVEAGVSLGALRALFRAVCPEES